MNGAAEVSAASQVPKQSNTTTNLTGSITDLSKLGAYPAPSTGENGLFDPARLRLSQNFAENIAVRKLS